MMASLLRRDTRLVCGTKVRYFGIASRLDDMVESDRICKTSLQRLVSGFFNI